MTVQQIFKLTFLTLTFFLGSNSAYSEEQISSDQVAQRLFDVYAHQFNLRFEEVAQLKENKRPITEALELKAFADLSLRDKNWLAGHLAMHGWPSKLHISKDKEGYVLRDLDRRIELEKFQVTIVDEDMVAVIKGKTMSLDQLFGKAALKDSTFALEKQIASIVPDNFQAFMESKWYEKLLSVALMPVMMLTACDPTAPGAKSAAGLAAAQGKTITPLFQTEMCTSGGVGRPGMTYARNVVQGFQCEEDGQYYDRYGKLVDHPINGHRL